MSFHITVIIFILPITNSYTLNLFILAVILGKSNYFSKIHSLNIWFFHSLLFIQDLRHMPMFICPNVQIPRIVTSAKFFANLFL